MDSQNPVPPTPPSGGKPIRRPVATARAIPVRVKKRWDFLEIFLWLAILGGGGAFAYYRLHPRPAAVAEESGDAKKSGVATPAPATAEPAPTLAPEPAAPTPAPMLAKETAPRDEPARPAAALPAPAAPVASQPLVLDENAGKKAENIQRSQAALDTALLTGKWTDYLDLLDRALAAELKKATGLRAAPDYDRFLHNPLFAKALVQRTTLRQLPSSALAAVTADTAHSAFWQWLFTTPEAMESLLLSLKPEDDAAGAPHLGRPRQRRPRGAHEIPRTRPRLRAGFRQAVHARLERRAPANPRQPALRFLQTAQRKRRPRHPHPPPARQRSRLGRLRAGARLGAGLGAEKNAPQTEKLGRRL